MKPIRSVYRRAAVPAALAAAGRRRDVCPTIRLWAFLAVLVFASSARADIISLDSEIRIGREVASQVERELPLSKDPLLIARVERIGRRLAMVSGRPELPFEFHVIEAREVNAFALPGGIIYVYRGLLQAVPNDDAVAFILGHEITHATKRHALRQFKKNTLVDILSIPLRKVLGASGRDWLRLIMQQLYSREDEGESDRLGLENAVRAGFSPDGGPQAMETLLKMYGKGGSKLLVLLQDHPMTDKRLRKLKAQAEQIKSARIAPAPKDGLLEVNEAKPAPPAPIIEPVAQIAPLPAGESGSDTTAVNGWFPLAVGNRWIYRVSDNSGIRSQMVIKVIEHSPISNGNLYRIETKLDRTVAATSRLGLSPQGVYRWKGSQWDADWKFVNEKDFRVVGEETVSVPNGTHTALRVERLGAEGKPIAVGWFVKGIGLVKRESLVTGITESLELYEVEKTDAAVKSQ